MRERAEAKAIAGRLLGDAARATSGSMETFTEALQRLTTDALLAAHRAGQEAMREKAAKAMCVACKDGAPWCGDDCWIHNGERHHFVYPLHRRCDAAAIRTLPLEDEHGE
jgi:hypothetical protein